MSKSKEVDAYFQLQPAEVQERLLTIRELFHSTLPDTKESIRYQIAAFSVGKDYLYISAYKNHIGMYPMYDISELDKDMLPYRGLGTKDALHFKHNQPLPIDLIRKIITAKSTK